MRLVCYTLTKHLSMLIFLIEFAQMKANIAIEIVTIGIMFSVFIIMTMINDFLLHLTDVTMFLYF